MRVVVNLGTLRGFGSAGVGRSVLDALVQGYPQDSFTAWVPQEWKGQIADAGNLVVRWTQPGLPQKLLVDQVHLRRELRKKDVLFSLTDTSLIRSSRPHLLLIHQPHLVARPEELDFSMPPAFRARMMVMRRLLTASLSGLEAVTVQTNHMKSSLVQAYRYPADRVHVIPNGIPLPPSVEGAGQSLPPTRPFLFYPASPSPHKNHEIIPPILSCLRDAGCDVAFAVTLEPGQHARLDKAAGVMGVADRLIYAGTLTGSDVLKWMRASWLVVNPSRLESLGLPYLEAMSVAAPQVVADRPVQREVCGRHAHYADANSPESFARAILHQLSKQPQTEAVPVPPITWDVVADRYMAVLREISGR